MKNRLLFFPSIFIIIITIASCTRFIMFLQGAHYPKIESKESIIKYAEKTGMNKETIYLIRDSLAYHQIIKSIERLPEVRFYDSDGYEFNVSYTSGCTMEIENKIDTLDLITGSSVDSTSQLRDLMELLERIDGSLCVMESFGSKDIYVVIYWAKFTGKLNKKKVLSWENKLNSYKTISTGVIKINCDVIDGWFGNGEKVAEHISGNDYGWFHSHCYSGGDKPCSWPASSPSPAFQKHRFSEIVSNHK